MMIDSRQPRTVVAPSTEAQREIFRVSAASREGRLAYNELWQLQLLGSLDETALRASWHDVVERHDALSLAFTSSGDALQRCGHPLPLHSVDLSPLGSGEREQRLAGMLQSEGTQLFDLTAGPLVRATLVRLASEEHVLLFAAHHSMCDDWSALVILGDWGAQYGARVGLSPAERPVAPSFAEWARAHDPASLDGASDGDEDYWLRQFSTQVPTMVLPFDRPRPATRSFSSRRETRPLEAELVSQARRFAAREQVSLFATLFAAFAAWLNRVSGQTDLVVGALAAGQATGAGVVGHCVSVLPVRLRVDSGRSARELLRSVGNALLDAYDHRAYPAGRLARALTPPLDTLRQPLTPVAFNLEQGTVASSWQAAGLMPTLSSGPLQHDAHELFVNAVETEAGISLECLYNTDLLHRSTILRWLESYEVLLRAVVADAGVELGRLPLLTPADHSLIQTWNASGSVQRPEACVHQLFAEVAAERHAAVAVVEGAQSLTYGDLDRRSSQLANHLLRLGVRPDVPVGLCIPRSIDAIVALLGILKAGGAYVSLEPNYPAQRLAFMLQDAAIPAIVTTSDLARTFPAFRGQLILLDAERAALDAESAAAPQTAASGASLAYITYTSGSTGTPKGVEVLHRGVNRLVRGVDYVRLDSEAAVLHAAPLAFDASTFEIWGPLLNGGRCVLHPEAMPTPTGLADAIRTHGVTTAWLTAALFNAVVNDDPACLRGLRELLVGGEALSVPHVRRAQEALPETQLINGYGPTECTTFTTTYRIPRPLSPETRSVPIGRPILDTKVFVLDPRGNLATPGAVGELFVAGAGLARGYLRRPELSAERFVRFSGVADGALLYRTGDLVRFGPEGDLEFIGRQDNQVKVRGFRIELGEIETALAAHPGVVAAVVTTRPGADGAARLVAYVQPSPASAPSTHELREHLQRTLPDYMVPQTFVSVPALPLTAHGKVDRNALPEPSKSRPDLVTPYRAPGTPLEIALCAAFADVLGVEPVGARDGFFDLGGTSLLAYGVIQRLRRDYGVELSVVRLFEHPDAQSLAASMEAAPSAASLNRAGARPSRSDGQEPVAIVGMAGRFPGARDVRQFWRNVLSGIDSITTFSPEDLDPAVPAALRRDPAYVPRAGHPGRLRPLRRGLLRHDAGRGGGHGSAAPDLPRAVAGRPWRPRVTCQTRSRA